MNYLDKEKDLTEQLKIISTIFQIDEDVNRFKTLRSIIDLIEYEKHIDSLLNFMRKGGLKIGHDEVSCDVSSICYHMISNLADAYHPLVVELISPVNQIYREYLEEIIPILGDLVDNTFVICYNEITAKFLRRWIYRAFYEIILKTNLKLRELNIKLNNSGKNILLKRILWSVLQVKELITLITQDEAKDLVGDDLEKFLNTLTAEQRQNCQFYIKYYIKGREDMSGCVERFSRNSIILRGVVYAKTTDLDTYVEQNYKVIKRAIEFNVPTMI